MITINPNIYPKGGYLFREKDGTTHTADSWSGVVARVTRYRERQGQPVGDVQKEVILQACSRMPNLCAEDNGVTQSKQIEASLKTRVLNWLTKMRGIKERAGEEIRYVDQALHDARTDVCIRCPLDKTLPTGCSSCRAALAALRDTVVGHRRTDERIAACPKLGEYLPVSTW